MSYLKYVISMCSCCCVMMQGQDSIESSEAIISNSHTIGCKSDAYLCDVRSSNIFKQKTLKENVKQNKGNIKYISGQNAANLTYRDDVALANKGRQNLDSKSDDGFFFGLNVGATVVDTEGISLDIFAMQLNVGYTTGIDFGYRKFFNENLGLKYYLSYNFAQSYANSHGNTNGTFNTDQIINQNLLAFNVDFFYKFNQYFGFYIGVGLGAYFFNPSFILTISGNNTLTSGTYNDRTERYFTAPLNLGFEFGLATHSSINIGTKILLLTHNYDGRYTPNTYYNSYMTYIGYIYYF